MNFNIKRLLLILNLLAIVTYAFWFSKTSAYVDQQIEKTRTALSKLELFHVAGYRLRKSAEDAYLWIMTGNLPYEKSDHTATLLSNGKVLVAGGPGANSELYDPILGTWRSTGNLIGARSLHTATILPNGKVLITGGQGTSTVQNSAELYDPILETWIRTGNLATARRWHTATILPNGKVLVAGGDGVGGALNSSELYDPATGTWSTTGNLIVPRRRHTATLLHNGKVLIVGGDGQLRNAELYDPLLGTWSTTGSLTEGRSQHTAALMPNGKVLVAGGDGVGGALNSSELYDPATGTWSTTGSLTNARRQHTVTQLLDGNLIVVGGVNNVSVLSSTEIYEPTLGTWSASSNLNGARQRHAATILSNGKVLVAGGQSTLQSSRDSLTSAEIYDFAEAPFPSPIILNLSPDWITNTKGEFTLFVTGSNFVNGSIVRWNDKDCPTAYVSRTQLIGSIASSNTILTGNATITVFNPAPGGGTSNAVLLPVTNVLINVSAASYSQGPFAPESIVTAFGTNLATAIQVASNVPLPTSLAGTSVLLKDSNGLESVAPLFFVSPTQVNYLIPTGMTLGPIRVTITDGSSSIAGEQIQIVPVSPSIFSANSSGQGVAAGQVFRLKSDNTQSYEPIARYDDIQSKFVPMPIDLGGPSDQVFLILYGTGMRNFSSLGNIVVQIGGSPTQVLYVGPQGDFVGLDQVNVRVSRTLIGRGEVDVAISVNGLVANKVQISIK